MSMDIHQLKQSKILVVGDSCTDVYNYGTCDRISPEAPVPILKIEKTETKPGMACNVQVALESLGNSTRILTNSEKITKERYVCSKNMQHILRVDRGESGLIKPLNLDDGLLDGYDCLVISDYDKGFLPHIVCRHLVDSAVARNKLVFVDTKKTDISCFEGCILKLNQLEYEKVSKFPVNAEIITTLGAMGAIHNKQVYPTTKTEVFDVCGAGDTFLSAFVTSYMSFFSIPTAINFANRVASVSVQNFGNYTPNLGELK
jgi:bifunctional ADP-heptose synthase (sugar kinase/adenylyltransferase)